MDYPLVYKSHVLILTFVWSSNTIFCVEKVIWKFDDKSDGWTDKEVSAMLEAGDSKTYFESVTKQENVSMEHRCPCRQMDGLTNSEMDERPDERGSHNFLTMIILFMDFTMLDQKLYIWSKWTNRKMDKLMQVNLICTSYQTSYGHDKV